MYIINNVEVGDGVGDGVSMGRGWVSMKIAHIVIITNMAMKFINCYTIKIYVDGYQFLVQAILLNVLKHKDHIASFVSCSITALSNRVKRPCLVIGNNIRHIFSLDSGISWT